MEASGDLLTLAMMDEMGLELARKKKIDELVVQFYSEQFNRNCRVKLIVGEESNQEVYEQFAQKRDQEEREVIEQMMNSSASESRSCR